jgi:hypothetical protein
LLVEFQTALAGVIGLPTTAATPSDSPVNSRRRGTCVLRHAGISAAAVGALDRALDELAVERAVDDDRPAALELDQPAARA